MNVNNNPSLLKITQDFRREIPTVELLYICDEDFRNDVAELRKKFGIKTNAIDLVEVENIIEFDRIINSDRSLNNQYYDALHILCDIYNLGDSLEDVEMFVESGLTSYDFDSKGIVRKNPITKPQIKQGHSDIPDSFGCTIEFHIRTAVTQKDFEIWLSKHIIFLLHEINNKFKGTKKDITKLDNINKIISIIKLRDDYHKTYSAIADYLCNAYPDDQDVFDGKINEVSVRKIYNRYKNRYKRDAS